MADKCVKELWGGPCDGTEVQRGAPPVPGEKISMTRNCSVGCAAVYMWNPKRDCFMFYRWEINGNPVTRFAGIDASSLMGQPPVWPE